MAGRVKDAGLAGIMSVDPGGTTGVAWGVVDLSAGSVAEAVKDRRLDGSMEVTGTYKQQGEALAGMWMQRMMEWQVESGLPSGSCHLVVEDFILRVGQGSSDPSGLMPVRVAVAMEGVLLGWLETVEAVWQSPADAKNYGKKPRLQNWGCWVRGSEHQRDAWRHFALRVAKLM